MGHWELSHVSTSIVPNQPKKTQKTRDQIMDDLMTKNTFYVLSEAGQEDSVTSDSEAPKVPTESMHANPMRRTWSQLKSAIPHLPA